MTLTALAVHGVSHADAGVVVLADQTSDVLNLRRSALRASAQVNYNNIAGDGGPSLANNKVVGINSGLDVAEHNVGIVSLAGKRPQAVLTVKL